MFLLLDLRGDLERPATGEITGVYRCVFADEELPGSFGASALEDPDEESLLAIDALGCFLASADGITATKGSTNKVMTRRVRTRVNICSTPIFFPSAVFLPPRDRKHLR
jgi:hypothetical protein